MERPIQTMFPIPFSNNSSGILGQSIQNVQSEQRNQYHPYNLNGMSPSLSLIKQHMTIHSPSSNTALTQRQMTASSLISSNIGMNNSNPNSVIVGNYVSSNNTNTIPQPKKQNINDFNLSSLNDTNRYNYQPQNICYSASNNITNTNSNSNNLFAHSNQGWTSTPSMPRMATPESNLATNTIDWNNGMGNSTNGIVNIGNCVNPLSINCGCGSYSNGSTSPKISNSTYEYTPPIDVNNNNNGGTKSNNIYSNNCNSNNNGINNIKSVNNIGSITDINVIGSGNISSLNTMNITSTNSIGYNNNLQQTPNPQAKIRKPRANNFNLETNIGHCDCGVEFTICPLSHNVGDCIIQGENGAKKITRENYLSKRPPGEIETSATIAITACKNYGPLAKPSDMCCVCGRNVMKPGALPCCHNSKCRDKFRNNNNYNLKEEAKQKGLAIESKKHPKLTQSKAENINDNNNANVNTANSITTSSSSTGTPNQSMSEDQENFEKDEFGRVILYKSKTKRLGQLLNTKRGRPSNKDKKRVIETNSCDTPSTGQRTNVDGSITPLFNSISSVNKSNSVTNSSVFPDKKENLDNIDISVTKNSTICAMANMSFTNGEGEKLIYKNPTTITASIGGSHISINQEPDTQVIVEIKDQKLLITTSRSATPISSRSSRSASLLSSSRAASVSLCMSENCFNNNLSSSYNLSNNEIFDFQKGNQQLQQRQIKIGDVLTSPMNGQCGSYSNSSIEKSGIMSRLSTDFNANDYFSGHNSTNILPNCLQNHQPPLTSGCVLSNFNVPSKSPTNDNVLAIQSQITNQIIKAGAPSQYTQGTQNTQSNATNNGIKDNWKDNEEQNKTKLISKKTVNNNTDEDSSDSDEEDDDLRKEMLTQPAKILGSSVASAVGIQSLKELVGKKWIKK